MSWNLVGAAVCAVLAAALLANAALLAAARPDLAWAPRAPTPLDDAVLARLSLACLLAGIGAVVGLVAFAVTPNGRTPPGLALLAGLAFTAAGGVLWRSTRSQGRSAAAATSSLPPSQTDPWRPGAALTAPPGWYPDPELPGATRWWDGSAWAAGQPPG